MFSLLLNTADTEPRPFLVLTHSRLWVHKDLRGDTARTGDSNRPGGIFQTIIYGVMPSI